MGSKLQGVFRDSAGNAVASPAVTVNDAGTSTPATTSTQADLSDVASNPRTGDANGQWEIFVPPGDYRLTGPGGYDEDYVRAPTPPAAIHALDYGVLGKGADYTAEMQRAVDACEAIGGGDLILPAGVSVFSSTITANKPVRVWGRGHGADTSNSFESDRGVTTLVWGGTTGTGPMFHFVSATSGNWLFGCGVFNLKIDGAQLLTVGIRAEAVRRSQFGAPGASITIWNCQSAGIWCSGGNGGIWTGHNEFHLLYRRGAGTATQPSHGLLLGDPANDTLACVQNTIWKLWGQVHTGDMLRIVGNADNNRVFWLHSATEPGQTGYGLNLINGSNQQARNNVFYYVASVGGDLHFGSMSKGNRILHMTAEACSVKVDSGGQLHYDVLDESHADVFATLRHPLSDELFLPVRDAILSGSAAEGSAAGLWPSANMDPSAVSTARFLFQPPAGWSVGNVTKIRLHWTHAAAAVSKAWRVEVRVSTRTVGTFLTVQEGTVDQTLAVADSASVWEFADVTTTQLFLRGQIIGVSIQRLATHVEDTLAENLQLLGVTVVFQSSGPDSGSETYDVTVPYSS